MKKKIIVSIISLILFVCLSNVIAQPDIKKSGVTAPSDSQKALTSLNTPSNKDATKNALTESIAPNKELVVVSKTPELFTYTLAAIAILLTSITIVVAIITGVGWSIVKKVDKKVEGLEVLKGSFEQEQQQLLEQLQKSCDKHLEMLKITALGLGTINNAKAKLRDLLSDESAPFDDVYRQVQKTIISPDEECLRLYAKVLLKYENKIDMIRLIRNGILQYARNPQEE